MIINNYYDCIATTVTPGAGTYEYDREFEDNDNPAYSIALPLPQKPSRTILGLLPRPCLTTLILQMTTLLPIDMM